MKQKIYIKHILFTCIFACIFASCTKEEPDEASLVLSENTMPYFDKNGEEKTIIVTTNQKQWGALCSASGTWITLKKTGNALSITAAANTQPYMRTAMLLISAGDAHHKMEIKQSGADIIMVVTPGGAEFEQWAESRLFEINTNAENPEISVAHESQEWITVQDISFKGQLRVSVAENKTRERREGRIMLIAGDKNQEIIITQKGAMYYILPCTQLHASPKEVKTFELKRRSAITSEANPSWEFETCSPAFPIIKYAFTEGLEQLLTGAKVYASTGAVLLDNEFDNFMKDSGFAIREKWDDNAKIYYNKSRGTEILSWPNKSPHIYVTPKKVTTFDGFKEFPYWCIDEVGVADEDKIRALEKENNGVYSEEHSAWMYLHFSINEENNPCIGRGYWLNKDTKKMKTYLQIFDDLSLALYKVGGVEYRVRESFLQILEKEGFEFKGFNSFTGSFIFYRKEGEIILQLGEANFTGIGEELLTMHMWKGDLPLGNTVGKKTPFLISKETKKAKSISDAKNEIIKNIFDHIK